MLRCGRCVAEGEAGSARRVKVERIGLERPRVWAQVLAQLVVVVVVVVAGVGWALAFASPSPRPRPSPSPP